MSNAKLKSDDNDMVIQTNDDVLKYKGIFYGDDTEKKYYEAGAHFSYKALYRKLNELIKELSPSRVGTVHNHSKEATNSNLTFRKITDVKLNTVSSKKNTPSKTILNRQSNVRSNLSTINLTNKYRTLTHHNIINNNNFNLTNVNLNVNVMMNPVKSIDLIEKLSLLKRDVDKFNDEAKREFQVKKNKMNSGSKLGKSLIVPDSKLKETYNKSMTNIYLRKVESSSHVHVDKREPSVQRKTKRFFPENNKLSLHDQGEGLISSRKNLTNVLRSNNLSQPNLFGNDISGMKQIVNEGKGIKLFDSTKSMTKTRNLSSQMIQSYLKSSYNSQKNLRLETSKLGNGLSKGGTLTHQTTENLDKRTRSIFKNMQSFPNTDTFKKVITRDASKIGERGNNKNYTAINIKNKLNPIKSPSLNALNTNLKEVFNLKFLSKDKLNRGISTFKTKGNLTKDKLLKYVSEKKISTTQLKK